MVNMAPPSSTTTAQLSLPLVNFAAVDPGGWRHLFDRALAAEAAGVDRVTVSDHVVFGENLEAYARAELGGRAGGRQPTGPDGLWLDPLTVLSAVSAVTSRVRLGTRILLAALRRPVVLAKAAATLDVISAGRLDLGVGVGWQREEYEAAGLDFGARGRLLDHTLAVCQTLWTSSPAEFDDDELHFESIHCQPQPVAPVGVPVWISGTVSGRVASRLARFGRGWILWGPDEADPVAAVRRMNEELAPFGHDISEYEISASLPRAMDRVAAMVAAGVTDFQLQANVPAEQTAAIDYLGSTVEAFRAAAAD
jgi:probable F420-dependent oxidoreductase